MTARILVMPYGPSNSCIALRDALVQRLSGDRRFQQPRMMRREGSVFRGRTGDFIINYGNRSAPQEVFGAATVLNAQSALNNAANKLNALNVMTAAGVSTIPYTTRQSEAQAWVANGDVVYARTTLNGHSGEGIEVYDGSSDLTSPSRADMVAGVVNAPLYTKGITGRRREWRVHVFKGVITHVQVKRRRNGYQEDPNYRDDVRNHHTGWIYSVENINPNAEVLRNAVLAVQAMGLDFGAVDIISNNESAWVLEVNTAPGLQAETTMTAYLNAFSEFILSTVEGRPAVYNARFDVPAPQSLEERLDQLSEEPTDAEMEEIAGVAVRQSRQQTSAPTSVSPAQPVELTGRGHTNASTRAESLSDGYYVVTTRTDNGIQSNIIAWVSNGRIFRHGWNSAMDQDSVVRIGRRITQVFDGESRLTVDYVTGA